MRIGIQAGRSVNRANGLTSPSLWEVDEPQPLADGGGPLAIAAD